MSGTSYLASDVIRTPDEFSACLDRNPEYTRGQQGTLSWALSSSLIQESFYAVAVIPRQEQIVYEHALSPQCLDYCLVSKALSFVSPDIWQCKHSCGRTSWRELLIEVMNHSTHARTGHCRVHGHQIRHLPRSRARQ